VVLSNLSLVTDTNSPTVVVSGGSLTPRNVDIEGNSSGTQPAVAITGGTVDLGTAAEPGGNVFNGHGHGELIHDAGAGAVSALGNTFQTDGVTITSPYRIKDEIFDALNAGGGLVSYVANNVYVTQTSGSIQRGVDAVATEGTVNVEAGRYNNYDAGSKLLTVRFEGGPTLTQQRNPQDDGLRDVVVTGTAGNDRILFNPGGGFQVQVNDLPNARFAPTGRIVAYGLAGNDDIQVAGGLTLPAWLDGGDGNDRLNGGGGNNVLLGGAGDDLLIGGGGRNLLIGGLGADTLNAGSGDDLLIGGTTAFDANEAELAAIMAEWTSGRDYATRIANLSGIGSGPRNNGNSFLIASGPGATIFDDNAGDVLQGGSGMDWFFVGLSQDILHGRHDSEIVGSL
jgi:Ca2+-binding RTX toxin-like protein